jgi:cytochrome c peroxidase
VLGAFANPGGRGLAPQYTYLTLVQAAFQPAYWSSPQPAGDFTQAESNFAFFFGLAIQAYESTLVSADTPFDRFEEGSTDALTPAAQAGLQLFRGRGNCSRCHAGAETTSASAANALGRGGFATGRIATDGDNGFANTGVRPAVEDTALAGTDDFGNPFLPGLSPAFSGFFKVPGLRNVEFTGPYFHNGGQATLEQVVDFYSRAGDFPAGNLGSIRPLNLTPADRTNLVAFMKSLSDDRVRFERAPFDHPELCIPLGQLEASSKALQPQAADPRFALSAADKWAGIPAVGSAGNTVPLQTFDELLQGIGADGSRAHALTVPCAIP